MAIPRPSEDEIVSRLYNQLVSQTNLSADINTGIIGLLVKLVGKEIDLFWQYLVDRDTQSNVTTATGQSLDNIGLIIGVPRKAQSKATTLGLTRAVRFTNLGNITVQIPQGTRVWKSSNLSVAFFTSEGATIPAGSSSDLHVVAADTGSFYNVGIGELDTHNAPGLSVKVTNILPIQNGSLVESDDSYRERVVQEFRRRQSFNVENATALLRSVDGVRDVLFLNLNRGIGTFDAIVIPYSQSQADAVVANCQTLLSDAMGLGIDGVAKLPVARLLDIQVSLTFLPTAVNQENTRQSIKSQIAARMDALPIEDGSGAGSVHLAQLKGIALSADSSVVDVSISTSLDDQLLAPDGEASVGVGERVTLRVLTVQ